MDADDFMLVVLTGIGATLMSDVWAVARKRVFAITLPNFALVGRWIAHLARGQVRHDSISAAPPARAEHAIGWAVHYLIGVGFAFLLPAIWGVQWISRPTLLPAMLVGIGTVVAPFFIMQPAMGAGIAASRTPRPGAARIQSLVMHAVFGLGLYVTGKLVRFLSTGG